MSELSDAQGPSSTRSITACIASDRSMLCNLTSCQLPQHPALVSSHCRSKALRIKVRVVHVGGGSPVQAPHALFSGNAVQCVEGAAVHRPMSPSPTEVHVLLANQAFRDARESM